MLSYSDFERRSRGSDVVTPVGTPEHVKPGSFSHSCTRPILRDAARRRAAPQDEANCWRTEFKGACIEGGRDFTPC